MTTILREGCSPYEVEFQIVKDSEVMCRGSFFTRHWNENDLEYLGADLKALVVKTFREWDRGTSLSKQF